MSSNAAINDVDSRLAMELAIEISELPDILQRYGLTKEELKDKLNNSNFRQAVKTARITWKSDLSVKERIRIKSMVLVEDSLLELYSIFHDKNHNLTGRMDAFKSLSKVATVDTPDKDGTAAGERVHISINIPGVEKAITYEAEVITDHDREAISNGA